MMRKLVLGIATIVVIVAVAGVLLIRSWLDPESIRQTLERQASLAIGQPVAIGRAELTLWPRAGVTLHDFTVGAPAALTLKTTAISTAMRALLDRRIEDAEILIEDSTVDLPLLLATLDRLSGTGGAGPTTGSTGGVAADGSVDRELTVVNVRAIALRNIRVQAGDRAAVVAMASSLAGDRLQIDRASLSSEVTTLTATGVVESLAARRANLTVTAESLDLDGLLVFAQEFARQALPGDATASTAQAPAPASAGAVDITLDIGAARGRAGGVPFEQLTATARVTPGQVALTPLALGLFGGRLEGHVSADLTQPDADASIEATLSGVDMTRVTEFTGQPGALTGTMGGRLTMQVPTADPDRALTRARGNGTVRVTDGTMKGLQLVRPIVLAFGKPDAAQPASGGERFDRLDATFTLAGGVVTLTTLGFQSPDVELDGTGRLNLAGSTIDVQANARLSQALTAQAGRDLVRYTADDGRVTVPTTVSGTLEAPQVGVNVGGLARRAVENELRRQTDDLKQQGESAIRGLLRRKKQ